MILTLVESPYAGDKYNNYKYLIACMKDCLARGESPYASHIIFTQFLDDDIPEERLLGIRAGLAWAEKADLIAVYTDRGISDGMRLGIDAHKRNGKTIEFRTLPGWE